MPEFEKGYRKNEIMVDNLYSEKGSPKYVHNSTTHSTRVVKEDGICTCEVDLWTYMVPPLAFPLALMTALTAAEVTNLHTVELYSIGVIN